MRQQIISLLLFKHSNGFLLQLEWNLSLLALWSWILQCSAARRSPFRSSSNDQLFLIIQSHSNAVTQTGCAWASLPNNITILSLHHYLIKRITSFTVPEAGVIIYLQLLFLVSLSEPQTVNFIKAGILFVWFTNEFSVIKIGLSTQQTTNTYEWMSIFPF